MDRFLLDLRHSLRALWRTRGLALGAVLALPLVLDAFGVLFPAFGAGALILAVIGLYCVVSCGATQRRREFGVSIACG
jgi:hypothetical protein